MDNPITPLLIGLLLAVIIFQVWALIKLKQKNNLILKQSKEIQHQAEEQQARSEEVQQLLHEKRELIGVVSHDLKGPFNRIFALVQLMEISSDNLTPDQKEYVGKIHQIVADGLGMIRNLLDRRRLSDKGIELSLETLNISVVLNSLVKNYRTLADKKRIQIHYEAPPQVPVLADKLYFTRIVENLLSNALKFSPEQKNIFVKMEEDGNKFRLTIRDEGPGISEEDQKLMYKEFQKLTAKPTGGESSTGLGLSIAMAVAEKMNFTLYHQSEEGKGTTFFVEMGKSALPIAKKPGKI